MSPSILDGALRLALPLAVAAGYRVVGALHRDPGVAAEASYLGLLAITVLLCAVWATPRIGALFAALAVLLAALPWALPGTADRGAAGALLLAAALLPGGLSLGSAGSSARSIVAVAMGIQLLIRSPQLLSPTPSTVLATVGWAAVAGIAVEVLRRRWGLFPALLAAASAVVLGSGFGPWSSLALAAPAAAALATDAAASPAARRLAAAGLLLPLALDPERGLLLLFCAAAAAAPGRLPWLAGAAGLAALVAPGASLAAAPEGLVWGLLLLPTLAIRPLIVPERRLPVLCLLLAAAAHTADRSVLALPMVALALSGDGPGRLTRVLQGGWSATSTVATTLVAAYPWLRADPAAEALAVFGLRPGWIGAAVVGLAALAAGAAERLPRLGALSSRAVSWTLAALLGGAALGAHPPTAWLGIAREPVVLDASSPVWRHRIGSSPAAGSLVLDSALSNALSLPRGAPVAQLRLATSSGERLLSLRAGIESGEWAARRADVAATAGFAAPPPFLAWVAAEGGFFGQRYRAFWDLADGDRVESLEIRLVPGLPADLELTLFHLELRR